MIVVADTSPLNYLVQLQIVDVLSQLHGSVLIPVEVQTELTAPQAPRPVRIWATDTPSWLSVRSTPAHIADQIHGLDVGETAAISLAISERAEAVLLDERKARRIAEESFKLRVTGTLGTIRDAHLAGLINGYEFFNHLCRSTNFRLDETLRKSFPDLLEGK